MLYACLANSTRSGKSITIMVWIVTLVVISYNYKVHLYWILIFLCKFFKWEDWILSFSFSFYFCYISQKLWIVYNKTWLTQKNYHYNFQKVHCSVFHLGNVCAQLCWNDTCHKCSYFLFFIKGQNMQVMPESFCI
jgi:hypothetical protein